MARSLVGVYITAEMIYKDIDTGLDNFCKLLSQLSCSDAIFWCARINLALSASDSKQVNEQLIDRFLLTNRERYWINKYQRKRNTDSKFILFFRGQLLELMHWIILCCNDHEDDGKTFEIEENRYLFFKCALIASDIWSNRTYKALKNDTDDPESIKRLMLAPFRKGMEASKSAPELHITLGRGWIFFKEYFSRYHTSFNEEFINVADISFEDYITCFTALITNFTDPLNRTSIFNVYTLGDNILIPDILAKYLHLESQSLEEMRSSIWNGRKKEDINEENIDLFSTLPLRTKPIYSAPDGRSIILDPVYFHERLLVSPLFLLAGLYGNRANTVFTAFGYAFEDYCCDILKRMYSDTNTGHIVTCKRLYSDNKYPVDIDASIKHGNTAVIIEAKGVFIRESEITDNTSYTKELRRKYSTSNTNTLEKVVKGVGQLARTLKCMINQENNELTQEFSDIKRFYPVLLVHDNLLDSPLTIELLQKDFMEILDKDLDRNKMTENQIIISPIIVMTIYDLENLENSSIHFNLIDLLRDYSNQLSSGSVSLHNFIVNSRKYDYYRNQYLLNIGLEVLEKCSKHIFNGVSG